MGTCVLRKRRVLPGRMPITVFLTKKTIRKRNKKKNCLLELREKKVLLAPILDLSKNPLYNKRKLRKLE